MGQTVQIKQANAEYNVPIYRVSLVKDESIQFDQAAVRHAQDAQRLLRNFIKTKGQTDREQFCVVLLNTKNHVVGLNMVSMGVVDRTIVHPREILKTAILASASGIILGHNHISSDLSPSPDDREITKRMIVAGNIMGITVLDHLIISLEDDRYYSFADEGLMDRFRNETNGIGRKW